VGRPSSSDGAGGSSATASSTATALKTLKPAKLEYKKRRPPLVDRDNLLKLISIEADSMLPLWVSSTFLPDMVRVFYWYCRNSTKDPVELIAEASPDGKVETG
ncbi:unnamed protein product, partial [Amoebophrya sp. A25]